MRLPVSPETSNIIISLSAVITDETHIQCCSAIMVNMSFTITNFINMVVYEPDFFSSTQLVLNISEFHCFLNKIEHIGKLQKKLTYFLKNMDYLSKEL